MESRRPFLTIIFDVLVLFVIALIPLLWFPKGYMITSQDAAYPVNILENFKSRLFTWNGQEPLGRDYSFDMGSITIHGVETGFKQLGLSIFGAQKLTFVFWFFMIGISMYYGAYSLRKYVAYRYFSLIAAVLYSINFYLLALWRQGAGTTFSAYAALPLITSFYIRGLIGDQSAVSVSLSIAVVAFLLNAGGGLSIPLFGGLLLIILTATLYFPLLELHTHFSQTVVRVVSIIFFSFVFWILLNAYWILPFLSFAFINYHSSVASQVVLSGARAWMDSVSGYTSMLNLFRLQGFPDWYNNATHSYSGYFLHNPLLIFLSFVFPVTAYLALILTKEYKEKRLIVFFVLISLVALFFSAGTHKPTGYLMGLMVDYIPGFSIFRSAQYKFVPALYFSYALLIAYVVTWGIHAIEGRTLFLIKITERVKRVAALVVVSVILLYHFPYFTNNFFVWSKPLTLLLKIPDYVIAFKSWSDTYLSYDQRLFILPRLNTVWKTEEYTWNYFSPYSLINLVTDKPIIENLSAFEQTESVYVDRLYEELLRGDVRVVAKLTSLLQTPFALSRGDTFYRLNWIPAEDPHIFVSALQKLPGVKQVWENGPWQIFTLPMDPLFTDRIYGLDSLTQYEGKDGDSIGPVLVGSNNFIRSADLDTSYLADIRSKLSVSGAIFASPCNSCMLEDVIEDPKTSYVQLLPGSTFYFLKEWKEKKLESDTLSPQQLLGNRLGLSTTRTEELKKLINDDRDVTAIVSTGDKLAKYWRAIDAQLRNGFEKPSDFSLIKTLASYIRYEESTLTDLYNHNFVDSSKRPVVEETLANVLASIRPVGSHIDNVIFGSDWSTTKAYVIPPNSGSSEIFIDALSLGSPVRLPTAVTVGDTVKQIKPVYNFEDKISLGTYDLSGLSSLALTFPKAENLLSLFRVATDNYPTWNQQCVEADIQQFNWQHKYKISFEPKEPTKGLELFLRKQNVVTQQISLSGYTVPNISFDLERQKDSAVKTFYFEGTNGETGATLYLCSHTQDPVKSIKALTVEEVIAPSVYIIPTSKSTIYKSPQHMTYERVNPTHYIIHHAGRYPTVLVFNERFNAGWRLYEASKYPKKFRPWSKEFWIDSGYNSHHFRLYGFANAWYIDPSFQGDLVLTYYPQMLYYRGIVISVSGLFLVAVVFCFRYYRRRYEDV